MGSIRKCFYFHIRAFSTLHFDPPCTAPATIEGFGDELGAFSPTPRKIAQGAGCVNETSAHWGLGYANYCGSICLDIVLYVIMGLFTR